MLLEVDGLVVGYGKTRVLKGSRSVSKRAGRSPFSAPTAQASRRS